MIAFSRHQGSHKPGPQSCLEHNFLASKLHIKEVANDSRVKTASGVRLTSLTSLHFDHLSLHLITSVAYFAFDLIIPCYCSCF